MNARPEPPYEVSAEPEVESPSLDPIDPPAPPTRVDSAASYESLDRHRRRNPRTRRPVKETLDARSLYTTSQDDGAAEHHINQYLIKQEIGRGSFGAVHLAADRYGNEYAVKEFSKSRLRKRAQSHMLRRPRGPRRHGTGSNLPNSPMHRHPSEDDNENAKNPLYLIKEEIAIMKKLNHNNLVSLIEVLDDPTEDSLYMVMEMCKKGVVMKVGLEEQADPYDDEQCRCWFRDLILGIEYLHAQGIVHRDIKPDNCLVTSDDVLKVVDFGVSEMFAKDSDMFTAKSAGSPAFLPPELCVVKHGDVSGKATDIWSMGVTLYCLRYGRLPFEKSSIFELYESIRNDPVVCENELDERFEDLMSRLLEKDPSKRIGMQELREHPWVTMDGADPLLSEEENTAHNVEPPTEEEMNAAITKSISHVMTLMKAVRNFKQLVDPNRAPPAMQSILGGDIEAHFVEPPMEMDPDEDFPKVGLAEDASSSHAQGSGLRKILGRHPMLSGSQDPRDSPRRSESASSRTNQSPVGSKRPSGVFEPERKDSGSIRSGRSPWKAEFGPEARQHSQSGSPLPHSRASSAMTKRSVEGTRGHARDPLADEFPYLHIGPSTYTGSSQDSEPTDLNIGSDPAPLVGEPESMDEDVDQESAVNPVHIVSESPGAAEFDIYETAYRNELERINSVSTGRTYPGVGPKVFLNRRIENKNEVMDFVKDKAIDLQIGTKKILSPASKSPATAFSAAVSILRNQIEQKKESELKEQAQQSQKAESSVKASTETQPTERRAFNPASSTIRSQSIPGPEPSSLEATAVPTTEPHSGEDPAAQLRRLLTRAQEKLAK
ncbi:Calcium/calmodulin-dependent protein kinase kinase cmkC [Penicillium malachiteum]|uniref:Calcium/calmodulin-dependent protein kinase kinase cmkC n=1 Tax=Penicillium malachiteum TaxID=1324776 RepID=UPI00254714FF|nr:Calcium/calmodulin-dependent protein kinase kinase cmkC [Penicillium malachiteum]KAJ5736545.1 Calcium/calmodulin-dependent protein kinase kinase cmkC [Penicillium malachiteum]